MAPAHVSTSGADGHGYALYTHGFLLIIQCISLTAVCGKCLHQLVVVGDGVLCDGRQAMLANDGFHLFGGHLTEHGLPQPVQCMGSVLPETEYEMERRLG